MNAMTRINEVLNDPSVSTAAKVAIRAALNRDPLDAARDAELVASLMVQRCDELLGGARD